MGIVAPAGSSALADEAVGCLRGLLRIDTTNPPGNETAAAQYLGDRLRQGGYEPCILESAPGRGNLVVRYAGTGELPPLLLYGHVDVVTAEERHWTHAPFSGDLAEGCLWGRGAIDMKGTVAQQVMVMLRLQREGIRLKRDVIFAATADEETGGHAGMQFLVDQHPNLIRAEYGLSEGGGTTMYIAGQPFYDIRTAEKGTCRLRLRTHGNPGHGSIPRANSSVLRLAEAVTRLATTSLPFRSTPTVEGLFEVIADALGMPRDRRHLSESNLLRVMQLLPADFAQYMHAITHDTAVPTGLRAGHKINVVPSEAEALVDGRYLPGQTPDGFLAEIRRIVGGDVEIEPMDVNSPEEDAPGNPLYATIVDVMRHHAPAARVVPIMLAGATDAKHVARLGTRCLGFGPIRVPEGFPAEQLVHGHDERVPIDGYLWGIDALYHIVADFCSN